MVDVVGVLVCEEYLVVNKSAMTSRQRYAIGTNLWRVFNTFLVSILFCEDDLVDFPFMFAAAKGREHLVAFLDGDPLLIEDLVFIRHFMSWVRGCLS